ncbi:unnamed protein product [Paramecium primaurelia]|uniref:Transmembrane protein n=1 Tax=Paramecium primaurelia TaxID=5886 RepID=A0A8S1QQZ2_PARPR|nr:unnamed protein product [Paramecium primaurelia]
MFKLQFQRCQFLCALFRNQYFKQSILQQRHVSVYLDILMMVIKYSVKNVIAYVRLNISLNKKYRNKLQISIRLFDIGLQICSTFNIVNYIKQLHNM